jgi:acyl-coenzyme A thioesterase PaaI-like protein
MEHELKNPFLETIGARLVAWREGYAEMSLAVSPMLRNRSGVVQGGAMCALLDAAAGYAGLYTMPGAPCVHGLTLSLTTNFLATASGNVLNCKGYLEKKGCSVYFGRAELWMDDMALVATAVGTFRYMRSGNDRAEPGASLLKVADNLVRSK